MKAKPGPESATSSMDLFVTFAIKPNTEKMTKPDNKQVPSLKHANINVSLLFYFIRNFDLFIMILS